MVQDNGVILGAVNVWPVILGAQPAGADPRRPLQRRARDLTGGADTAMTLGHGFYTHYIYIYICMYVHMYLNS